MPPSSKLLELTLKPIGPNFSQKLLKDKTLHLSSTSVEPLHQPFQPQLHQPQLRKLPNQNPKNKSKKYKHHLKNNKKMEEWADYLIEIFKLYYFIFSFYISNGLSFCIYRCRVYRQQK